MVVYVVYVCRKCLVCTWECVCEWVWVCLPMVFDRVLLVCLRFLRRKWNRLASQRIASHRIATTAAAQSISFSSVCLLSQDNSSVPWFIFHLFMRIVWHQLQVPLPPLTLSLFNSLSPAPHKPTLPVSFYRHNFLSRSIA